MAVETVVVSRGVDWITATCNSPSRQPLFLAIADAAKGQSQANGNDLREWQWNGYQGYACGPVSAGTREDGAVVRLSGSTANASYRHLGAFATNCSRLDLQVTVQVPDPTLKLAQIAYRSACAWARNQKQPPTVTILQTHPVGDTLYLGRRQSNRFARLYDKHAEDPEQYPPGSWRYEVELKAEVANAALRQLRATPDAGQRIQAQVWVHFAQRGVLPAFGSSGPALDLQQTNDTDDRSRMRWLEEQVRPAVAKALERHSVKELRRLLGLE